MRSFSVSAASVLATLVTLSSAQGGQTTQAGQYTLTDNLSYGNFFSVFDFFSGPDPTKGFVQYQNRDDAINQGLVGYLEDTKSIYIGVDHTTQDPAGRASVRLESKKSWNKGLLVADIRHMPASVCGTWLAMWMLSSSAPWPNGGEIDIIEGVNDYDANSATLHTSKGCMIDNATVPTGGSGGTGDVNAPFSGLMTTDDCDVNALGQGKNVGCSIHAPATTTMPGRRQAGGSSSSNSSSGTDAIDREVAFPSYGTDFNKALGGVYAMEWTSTSISVWFFPRDSPAFDTHFSADNLTAPDLSTWGTPMAHFSGSGCDFTQRFKDLKIIFNTAFCGEWAGKEWDTCAKKTAVSTCNDFVQDNPDAFQEAYWEIAGLKWFEKTAGK